jgi:hypothetical protein
MPRISNQSKSLLGLLALTFSLGACSIHPLPNDVTGYKTATIVRKIRCEAKEAIKAAEVEILRRHHPEITDVNSLPDLSTIPLTSGEKAKLITLVNIGIVYDFSFNGDEMNNLTFNSDIIKTLGNGLATFSPSLGNNLERQNVRAFTVSDSFASLLKLGKGKDDRDHCEFTATGPNYEYPIAGRIGLDEMIQTYVRLAVSGDLVAEDASAGAPLTPAGAATMVDTLIFTTTISAGLTPKVSLNPVGTDVQLMDASLMGMVQRKDIHKVIIGMAVGKSNTPATAAFGLFSTAKTTALLFTTDPKHPGQSGEALAAQAVTQYIIRHELRTRATIAIGP